MKKRWEQILAQEIETPEYVRERVEATFAELGIQARPVRRTRRRPTMRMAAAIAAVLIAGCSIVTVAAVKLLSVSVTENGENMAVAVSVDREKEAHAIEVEPTYMPEGYVLQPINSPHGGKWRNEETGGGITILPWNAAELDRAIRLEEMSFRTYQKDEYAGNVELDGQKLEMFVGEDFYIDSGKTNRTMYLFNEEEGYLIEIFSNSDLSADELVKVAKGIKVTVLDETVPYLTDAELAEIRAKDYGNDENPLDLQMQGATTADFVYEIGEEIQNPAFADANRLAQVSRDEYDVRFTVQSVEVRDTLPAEEFPVENYPRYEEVRAWLNEDGTLMQHDRYRLSWTDEEEKTLETGISSKFVVVKLRAENMTDHIIPAPENSSAIMEEIDIAPRLGVMKQEGDGALTRPQSHFFPANEGYSLQWGAEAGSNFPVYFDKMQNVDGIQKEKRASFCILDPGEEMEYTLAYVVDEDQIEELYLWFFPEYATVEAGDSYMKTPYVKIK